jgi:phage gp36-like protein
MSQKDLAELTVDVPSGNPVLDAEVTATVTAAALEESSGRVDSYCRARYVTPLQQSDDVTSLVLDITVYLLFSRRRESRIADTVQERFNQAISFLKDISSGKASLDQPATALTPQSSTAGPQISQKDRHLAFREENIRGFI